MVESVGESLCAKIMAHAGLMGFNFLYFGHNFPTRNAKKPIKPCKDSYYSLVSDKNSSRHMALSLKPRAWWCHPKMREPTPIMTSLTKNENFKTFLFLNIETTRLSASLEGLNSPLAQSTGELWPSAKMAMVTFAGHDFLPIFGLCSHNFGPRNARKTIKGSN